MYSFTFSSNVTPRNFQKPLLLRYSGNLVCKNALFIQCLCLYLRRKINQKSIFWNNAQPASTECVRTYSAPSSYPYIVWHSNEQRASYPTNTAFLLYRLVWMHWSVNIQAPWLRQTLLGCKINMSQDNEGLYSSHGWLWNVLPRKTHQHMLPLCWSSALNWGSLFSDRPFPWETFSFSYYLLFLNWFHWIRLYQQLLLKATT